MRDLDVDLGEVLVGCQVPGSRRHCQPRKKTNDGTYSWLRCASDAWYISTALSTSCGASAKLLRISAHPPRTSDVKPNWVSNLEPIIASQWQQAASQLFLKGHLQHACAAIVTVLVSKA